MGKEEIIAGISWARLAPYKGDTVEEKLREYTKNTQLCEALYPALHTVEIVTRNRATAALVHLFDNEWYKEPKFRERLMKRSGAKIDKAVRDLKGRKKPVCSDAVVAELTFGFWTHLFSKEYEQWFYVPAASILQPYAPRKRRARKKVQGHLNSIRDLRNRVAHYEPILYRESLVQEHQVALELIGDMNAQMRIWLQEIDRFPDVAAACLRLNCPTE